MTNRRQHWERQAVLRYHLRFYATDDETAEFAAVALRAHCGSALEHGRVIHQADDRGRLCGQRRALIACRHHDWAAHLSARAEADTILVTDLVDLRRHTDLVRLR